MLTDEDIARIRGCREPEPKRGPNPLVAVIVLAVPFWGVVLWWLL